MPASSALERALLLGVVTGLRSLLGVALLSHNISHRNPKALQGTLLAPLTEGKVAKALSILSAGEIAADKLPMIPARTESVPLLGRALLGGLAGATVCAEVDESPVSGAVVGATAAVAATFGAYYLRQWLDKGVRMPDTLVAIAEDAVAVSLGKTAIGS